MAWLHLSTMATTTFFASLVEFVEALTIVLAVGVTRNWRSAIAGTIAAIVALILLITFSAASLEKVPITWMQLVVGTVIAIFGFRWLKKATLRSAGIIPMHDEDKEFAETVKQMVSPNLPKPKTDFEKLAMLTAFKAVFLEGFEVAFIVITAGSVSRDFKPALIGAGAALLLVIIVGFFVHKPLSRVPENTLKKTVGVLLLSFGIFWVGEGLRLAWPLGDGAILVLAVFIGTVSLLTSSILDKKL